MTDKDETTMPRNSDMEFADMEVPWGTDEKYRSYNRLRWAVAIIYVILVLVVSLLPLFVDWDEMTLTYLILIVTFGGMIVLFVVLFKPYLKRDEGVVVKDGLVVDSGVVRRLRPGETYKDVVRFDMTLYIIMPTIIVMGGVMFAVPEPTVVAIIGMVVVLLAVLAVIFTHLVVEADRESLSFHYGPVGKDVPLDDVQSIRAVAVHPMKEFMGYGIRVGPDGTVGYIAKGNIGVRVAVKDGKEYVITVNDPQGLVEYVRAAKAEMDLA